MKKVLLGLFGILVLAAGYFTYSWISKKADSIDPLQLIPTNAIYFLEAEDPIKNWNTFSQSKLWTFLKTHPSFAEITEDADYLDELIDDNKQIFKLLDKRHFYMSAHMKGSTDYDFLFLVDLEQASKLGILPELIRNNVSGTDFIIREDDYKGHTIIDLKDKSTFDHLYITQIKNYLVCSYTDDLVLNSIDQSEIEDFVLPLSYKEVSNRVDNDGLARLYVNYSFVDDYLHLYLTGNTSSTKALSQSFSYTGLDMQIEEDEAYLRGYTSLPDIIELYSKILQKHGNTSFSFDEVISARTAYLLALGIDKFDKFYRELIALREKEGTDSEYKSIKNTVENVLGLNLEKDLLAWIGDEIVLAQNKASVLHRNEDDLIVAIRADDIDFAEEKLLLLQKRIKWRTPAKFKKMQYKTYPIYYLDIKGFFNVFFGKAFAKLTKPYYTIIGDYVIFSNSPKTLVSAIEDYENGLVLKASASYQRTIENISSKSTLLVYANGPQAYDVLAQNINPKEAADYRRNKPYITFFKSIGISYEASGDGFESTIYMHFAEDLSAEDELPADQSDKLAAEYLEDYSTLLQGMTNAETFVLKEINDGEFEKHFAGTSQLQIKAETKDGRFHGDFEEYYQNGNKRSEGTYRKGRKTGRWKYYNEQGELTEKEWEGL
jgi:hypothetical protein